MPPEVSEIFHSRESVFCFHFRGHLWGKTDEGRSSRSPKEHLKFIRSGWKISKMREWLHLAPSRSQLAQSIHWIQRWGQLKFNHLVITPWYLFRVIPCEWKREVNFFWDRRCFSRGAFLHFREGNGLGKHVGTPPDTTYARHLNDFSKIF